MKNDNRPGKRTIEEFLDALIDNGNIENPEIFPMMEELAKLRGYTLTAEQRGIRGTYIHFTKA